MLGLHLFSVVFLIVSSSLLAKTAVAYHDSFICKNKNALGRDAHCYHLTIGVVNINILYFIAWRLTIDFFSWSICCCHLLSIFGDRQSLSCHDNFFNYVDYYEILCLMAAFYSPRSITAWSITLVNNKIDGWQFFTCFLCGKQCISGHVTTNETIKFNMHNTYVTI